MPEPTGVLVIGDINESQLGSTSKELIAAGKGIADSLNETLSIALLGSSLGSIAQQAIEAGADQVYSIDNPVLEPYHVELHLAALCILIEETTPRIVLMGRTVEGRELAPRLAFRLGVGLAQDCLEISMDTSTGRLLANRPVYGGSAVAVVSCEQNPQVAAIRPKAYEPLESDTSRSGEIIAFPVELNASDIKTKVIDTVKEEAAGIKLEDARIVIAGGRGLGGPEPFADLQALADILGAGVGASRAAVDSGWVPYSYQVGLTGKTITPEIYITVAISGASQHMAGCSGSNVIVAINKDSEANIFKDAKYGVVGDWEAILPAFTESVRELTQD